MSAKWYIVNTLSGFEHKVALMIRESAEKRGLQDKFEDVVVPTENVASVKKGKKVISEKKIYPGYILIKMVLDDVSWNLVKNIPKVVGFLGGSGKPLPVHEREVNAVLMQVEAGSVAKDLDITFEIGENVKIIEGPFETFTGLVDEFDPNRKKLKISVSIFGRATPVELELHQVEKIK